MLTDFLWGTKRAFLTFLPIAGKFALAFCDKYKRNKDRAPYSGRLKSKFL